MSCCSTSAGALRLTAAMAVSVSPNCNCNCNYSSMKKTATMAIRAAKSNIIRCEVAINAVEESTTLQIGARVKVKVPLKVYHVPKIGELDLTGMEGEIKQYVGLWNGKRISANLPYKVQFVTDIQGRGPVKFFAHLKEDEFDLV
ncbi:ferredoxin-thioredoxin reductase, variable chain [Cajanus cajan]|uniref:Ferredoxin-thioredoxin reductase, variable chain n=1 Tax=Cajanus cajan TaxID=3821 RepID=A0A151QX41_CAJCA|nr:ferredoxin-thioredoxin reductase, variable chain [Cajanus cajan]KYP34874.1 Ferredoxin-thioredoxin reductase, variable chain [Cajanus cajan]